MRGGMPCWYPFGITRMKPSSRLTDPLVMRKISSVRTPLKNERANIQTIWLRFFWSAQVRARSKMRRTDAALTNSGSA